MSMRRTIEAKLVAALTPVGLEVVDESHKHSVPSGSESHFSVVVVSDRFDGASRLNRHRMVNDILRDELADGIHALSIQAFTVDEWSGREGRTMTTPECLGGSAADK
jgi:BolA protein